MPGGPSCRSDGSFYNTCTTLACLRGQLSMRYKLHAREVCLEGRAPQSWVRQYRNRCPVPLFCFTPDLMWALSALSNIS